MVYAVKMENKRLSHIDRAHRRVEMAKAVLNGLTVEQAAIKYGVSIGTVGDACRSMSVPIRSKVTGVPGRVGLFTILSELLNSDLTQSAIAEKLGVSRAYVGAIYTKARAAGINIPVRPKNVMRPVDRKT